MNVNGYGSYIILQNSSSLAAGIFIAMAYPNSAYPNIAYPNSTPKTLNIITDLPGHRDSSVGRLILDELEVRGYNPRVHGHMVLDLS